MLSGLSSFAIVFALISCTDGYQCGEQNVTNRDPCGPQNNIAIIDCSSTEYLYSPNLCNLQPSYGANLTCTWTLTVPAACSYGMVAFFDWLSTDCSDSVHISRGSHHLATWSGVSRSSGAFSNSQCQHLAPLEAIYLSNKYSSDKDTQLTIQLQSSSTNDSLFRQGFTVSFGAITLTNQSFGSHFTDAFEITKSSALLSTSDQLSDSSSSEVDFLEAFILPPTPTAYDISFVGNGEKNDSIEVRCLPPPNIGDGSQTSTFVRNFEASENSSTTLCVRPAIVVHRTLASMHGNATGIVANYLEANDVSNCSSSNTPVQCQFVRTTTVSTASTASTASTTHKSAPNLHAAACHSLIYFTGMLTIFFRNLMRN
uniref:CUB domain-containing protein n=1 Tax=Plectus sambesii TaxID=2011161 RepID=A0A914ULP5_9BILA